MKFDNEDPKWRKKTCILLDGASYHTSKSTIELLDRLRVPFIINGPYSYDSQVCELFFSYLKS